MDAFPPFGDVDWFARDIEGNLAFFASAGFDVIPKYYWPLHEMFDGRFG